LRSLASLGSHMGISAKTYRAGCGGYAFVRISLAPERVT
jgi:hypothetical protein